jgi:ketosteroid isomerase-like protein
LRVSLYADDATLFLNPIRQEIQGAMWILAAFAQASGLITNFTSVQSTLWSVQPCR